jgi:OmpA-OmpF porin, OOP family
MKRITFAVLASSTLLALSGAAIAQTTPATTASGAMPPADAPAAAAAPAVQKVSVKGLARFDFNRIDVNGDDGSRLMGEVRSMKNVTWQTIRVVGHTDSIGSDQYNRTLSQRRADAVESFLVGKGVKLDKIRTAAMGKSQPVASNATAAGRAANRRAEIEFQGLQTIAQ